TMRTPGHDFELVAGLLLGEGIVDDRDALRRIAYCTDPQLDVEQRYNVVTAELRVDPGAPPIARHLVTSSACGVGGSTSIDAVRTAGHPPLADVSISFDTLCALPDLLRGGQRAFAQTGGLHAAALATTAGDVVAVREDVGRHNAVDKVVGWALLDGRV